MVKVIFKILPIVSAVAIITVGVILVSGCRDINAEIDAKAMHYDADGYFVVIDNTHDVLAVYDAEVPLEHFPQRVDIEADYIVTTIAGLNDYDIELSKKIISYLDNKHIPYTTPVVIFEV